LKTLIKLFLQKILGFSNYLFLFSLVIIKKLRWDRNEKDFLHFLSLLPADGVVLDIGANIGVMSYYLAKATKQRIVHAFEPIPYNFKNLERIKRKYKLDNLSLHLLALGDEDGSIEMVLPMQNSVRFHGLAHVKSESSAVQNEDEIFNCPILRLDNFKPLKEGSGRITGIKMDVENYEYLVLKGATELLKKHKPVIYCELWDNENRVQSMKLLNDLGYRTQVLEKDNLVDFIPEKHTTQNFFFIHEPILL
jgi:FkbM family methyltransferase